MYFRPKDVHRLAQQLTDGDVGILAVDTIWGLMGVASEASFEILTRLKKRSGAPFLLLTDSISRVQPWLEPVSDKVASVMGHAWPGPTTLLLNAADDAPFCVTQDRPTIGVRIPSYTPLLYLLKLVGRPVFSTSLNLSGEPAIHSLDDVPDELMESVDFVSRLWGPYVQTESAIVDCSEAPFRVVRGSVPFTL